MCARVDGQQFAMEVWEKVVRRAEFLGFKTVTHTDLGHGQEVRAEFWNDGRPLGGAPDGQHIDAGSPTPRDGGGVAEHATAGTVASRRSPASRWTRRRGALDGHEAPHLHPPARRSGMPEWELPCFALKLARNAPSDAEHMHQPRRPSLDAQDAGKG